MKRGDDGSVTSLNDKVAIVTGSTKGIGYGIALAYAEAGADLVIVSRNEEECRKVSEKFKAMGRKALPVAADLSCQEDIDRLVNLSLQSYGKIDVLVNNAGTAVTKAAEELEMEDWERVINLNLRGVFFCSQRVGKEMIRLGQGGKIINIASIFGLVGERFILPYCVAKGGVIQLTKALALEWAKYGIQVNALCPGYVKTPMNEKELSDPKIQNHLLKKIPMRRFGEAAEIAPAAVFLGSEGSNYMTGQTLVVDGGWTAE